MRGRASGSPTSEPELLALRNQGTPLGGGSTLRPRRQASRCGATPRGPSGDAGVSSSSQGPCERGRRPIWTEHWEGLWAAGGKSGWTWSEKFLHQGGCTES